MRKSKNTSIVKTIEKTSKTALPIVNHSIESVGSSAKSVVVHSAPVVEKGVSAVYGSLATGFDLGVKGAKTVAKGVQNLTKRKKHSKKRHTKKRRSTKSRKHRKH